MLSTMECEHSHLLEHSHPLDFLGCGGLSINWQGGLVRKNRENEVTGLSAHCSFHRTKSWR